MKSFLLWIGAYNVLGALVLPLLVKESIADKVLRTWLQFVAAPYRHGEYGALWIWWSAMTNLFLGAIMMMASRWQGEPQRAVAAGAVGVYVIGVILGLFAARSPRYNARGVLFSLLLWVAQIAWGVHGLVSG